MIEITPIQMSAVTGFKWLVALMVIVGLLTAAIFSFIAAIPMASVISTASSYTSMIGAAAFFGNAIGLSISSVGAIALAKASNMDKYTGNDLADAGRFIGKILVVAILGNWTLLLIFRFWV